MPIWPVAPGNAAAGPAPSPPLRPTNPYTQPSLAEVNGDPTHSISANDLLASLGLDHPRTLSPQFQADWLKVVDATLPLKESKNGHGERSDGDESTRHLGDS
ncbi:MAG: hypothetical protein R2761_17045 [Acidimicrobiales bacterium]